MEDKREARFLKQFPSVESYLKRILNTNTDSAHSEYVAWRGDRTAIIYRTGTKYPIEMGELKFRENYKSGREGHPFDYEKKKEKPRHDPEWVLEPTSLSRERPITIDENEHFKEDDVNFREPQELPTIISRSKSGGELGDKEYLRLPNLPDILQLAEPEKVFTYWRWGRMDFNEEPDGRYVECLRLRIDAVEDKPKKFLTFTRYEDGDWHVREPAEFHRLYGLAEALQKRVVRRLFIFEGEKTCREVRRKSNLPPHGGGFEHPFDDFMAKDSAYVGWGFGALNPYRVDWDRLAGLCKTLRVSEVIIVPDSDEDGRKAVRIISRSMSRSDIDIRWMDTEGLRVPEKWDFADPIPDSNWGTDSNGNRIWSNNSPERMLRPANWLSQVTGTTDSGAPTYGPSRSMLKDYVYIPSMASFTSHTTPHLLLTQDKMKPMIRHLSDTQHILDRYLETQIRYPMGVSYRPDNPTGMYYDRDIGGFMFNQFVDYRPVAAEGSVEVFYEFIDHLCPNPEEKLELMSWIATILTYPERYFSYGVLLYSRTGGVGKSLLIGILRRFIGSNNVSEPSDSMLLESGFNNFMYNKLFVACHEIYAQENYRAVNRMKSMITERTVNINVKYGAQFETNNYAKFMCCSNSDSALALTKEDRRWLVVHGNEKKLPLKLKDRLLQWLNSGGCSALRWHFENEFGRGEYVEYSFIGEGDEAPMTWAKRQVTRNVRSAWSDIMKEALESLGDKELTTLPALKEYLKTRGIKNMRNSTYIDALEDIGFYVTPHERSGEGSDARIQLRYNVNGVVAKRRVILIGQYEGMENWSGSDMYTKEGEPKYKIVLEDGLEKRRLNAFDGVIDLARRSKGEEDSM